MTKRNAPADEPAADEPRMSREAAAVLDELKAELDLAVEARKRALADFANYQRRAFDNEQRAARDGTAAVARSLLGVLDHFDLALNQDPGSISVEQLMGGVRIVRDELLKALADHGVSRMVPAAGEEFDPNRHEAVMRLPSGDVAPDHIVKVLQPGYTMGDQVLRAAKVAVAGPLQGDSATGAGGNA